MTRSTPEAAAGPCRGAQSCSQAPRPIPGLAEEEELVQEQAANRPLPNLGGVVGVTPPPATICNTRVSPPQIPLKAPAPRGAFQAPTGLRKRLQRIWAKSSQVRATRGGERKGPRCGEGDVACDRGLF